jgi:predicted nuclease of predicted toxin-antitoxin system
VSLWPYTTPFLEAGNDVLEVREAKPGAADEWVISLAVSENRILLTEDKDFGWLIYAHGHKAIGVIFLRYPVSERNRINIYGNIST